MKVSVWLGFVLGALCAAGSVIHTSPGGRIILGCGIDTFKNSLTWNREKEAIFTVKAKDGMIHNGKAVIRERSRVRQTNLEISRVKKEDAGRFTCIADGTYHEHTLLVVSVSTSASPPEKELWPGSKVTLLCEVEGLSPDATVQWMRPGGPVHTGSGVAHLHPVAPSDAGTWACIFPYDGQTYSAYLDLKIREPPPKTHTSPPPQSLDNQTTCPHCDTGPGSGVARLGWWLWVAVGGGGLVVLLLLVLVIFLCRRVRRRKRKLQRMKKGQQSLRPKNYCQCNSPAAAATPQRGHQKGKGPSAPPRSRC